MPSLSIQHVGKNDLIQIFNGKDPVGEPCSLFELQGLMELLQRKNRWFPSPCSACSATGKLWFPEDEPRDEMICPYCNGSRGQPKERQPRTSWERLNSEVPLP